jgi:hypothetical protein
MLQSRVHVKLQGVVRSKVATQIYTVKGEKWANGWTATFDPGAAHMSRT